MDTKINFLDTPGFLDFQGDAIGGLAAADGALCVVSATAGVEVGTERMFREAVSRQDPVLFVVTMMDKEHADFDAIYQQIKARLTSKVIPIEVPVGEGPEFTASSTCSTSAPTCTRAAHAAVRTRTPTSPTKCARSSIATIRS